MYNFQSDKITNKLFINKFSILEYVTQEEIFELVFGKLPELYQYTTSPLREDNTPGCWFEYQGDKLVFKDFAYGDKPIDCFHAVQDYFKIETFPKTLLFIKEKLIKNKRKKIIIKNYTTVVKNTLQLQFQSRNFQIRDKLYWEKYHISKQNLIDDNVFPVQYLTMIKNNSKQTIFLGNKKAYAYSGFKNRLKIYMPGNNPKFINNCNKDDIGGLNQLAPFGELLIIKKSYKDYRVIKNLGYNTVWLQNEGIIPSDDILYSLIKRFRNIIVFYDNDATGIKASRKLTNAINSYFPNKSKNAHLPIELNQEGISDPSDLLANKGLEALKKQLKIILN